MRKQEVKNGIILTSTILLPLQQSALTSLARVANLEAVYMLGTCQHCKKISSSRNESQLRMSHGIEKVFGSKLSQPTSWSSLPSVKSKQVTAGTLSEDNGR